MQLGVIQGNHVVEHNTWEIKSKHNVAQP